MVVVPLMYGNIKNTSQYNVSNTSWNHSFNNKHVVEWLPQSKLNIIIFVKAVFMAELLHWIALHCTGVPNDVASQ